MEIELKYSIGDEKIASNIWEDEYLNHMLVADSKSTESLRAIYYDTEGLDLKNNCIAFRVRKEGDNTVATIKWNGGIQGALHKRNELNINLPEGAFEEVPAADVFGESEIGKNLIELVGNQSLIPIINVHVLRQSYRVEINNTLMELSLDSGQVFTDNGRALISELEIELFSGEEEELLKLGETIKEKYNLQPERRSKFERGLAFLSKAEIQEEKK